MAKRIQRRVKRSNNSMMKKHSRVQRTQKKVKRSSIQRTQKKVKRSRIQRKNKYSRILRKGKLSKKQRRSNNLRREFKWMGGSDSPRTVDGMGILIANTFLLKVDGKTADVSDAKQWIANLFHKLTQVDLTQGSDDKIDDIIAAKDFKEFRAKMLEVSKLFKGGAVRSVKVWLDRIKAQLLNMIVQEEVPMVFVRVTKQ
jgi:hypothetical protein